MAKNKQLNLNVLKQLDAKLNKTIEVTLSTGNTLQIDLVFRNSRIEEVFEKLLQIQKIIAESKDESLKNFNLEKYSYLLVILNFTSLKNIQLDTIEKELEVMKILTDQDNEGKTLFKEIIEKIEKEVPEELKKFNLKILEIMQERLESLKQQEQFMSILNEEMEKVKIEQENNIEGDEDFELE